MDSVFPNETSAASDGYLPTEAEDVTTEGSFPLPDRIGKAEMEIEPINDDTALHPLEFSNIMPVFADFDSIDDLTIFISRDNQELGASSEPDKSSMYRILNQLNTLFDEYVTLKANTKTPYVSIVADETSI